MHIKKLLGLAVIVALISLAGCASGPLSQRERYTYGGGAVGAAAGALIGAAAGGSAAVGAAIGGPVGAIGGFLLSNSLRGDGSGYRSSSPRRSSYKVDAYKSKAKTETHSQSTPSKTASGSAGEVF